MKKLAFILAAAALAAALSTARADITISDTGTIARDAAQLGNAADALLNKTLTSAEFQAALRARLAADNAAIAAAIAARDAALATQAALSQGIKDADAKPTNAEQRAALKVIADAERLTSKQKRLAAKQAELDRVTAEKTAILTEP